MKAAPRLRLTLSGLALVGLGLAPLDAAALSRTVHVKYSVLNDSGADVYVGVRAPYAREHQRFFPVVRLGQEQTRLLTAFTGDLFGASTSYAGGGETYGFRLPNQVARGMDAVDKIHGGHSRHYEVAFYDKVDGQYRAFASIRWKVKMNLRGILECHATRVIDPDHRLLNLHKRSDKGFNVGDFVVGLSEELGRRRHFLELLGAPPIADGNTTPQEFFDSLARWAIARIASIGAPSLPTDEIVDSIAFVVEASIKSAPGTCLTQLWVVPSTPPEARVQARMYMDGWGGSGYSFLGDFNGDQLPDVASASGKTLFLSASERPWEWRPQQIDTGSAAWGGSGYTFAGDFDGDGKDDVASADGHEMYLRRASRGFVMERWPTDARGKWGAAGYTRVGDFNGDGKADVASGHSDHIFVRYSTGAGFRYVDAGVPRRWGGAGYTWVADFNGDGKDDIASANGSRVYMKLGAANGFVHQEWPVPGRWGGAEYTKVGDYNGDGRADIASAYRGEIFLLLSTGSSFTATTARVPANWGGGGYTWAADVTGDGKDDLISARGGTVFVNASTGAGFEQRRWEVENWWGDAGYTFVADFDRDGRADIATANGPEVRVKLARF